MTNMRMRLLLSAAIMVLAPAADAATYVWNGGSADYATASNWTPSGPPGASDIALFDTTGNSTNNITGVAGSIGTLQYDASAFNYFLLIDGAGATYDINGAGMINNSGASQFLQASGSNAVINFNNSAAAGDLDNIDTDTGGSGAAINFNDSSNAGGASLSLAQDFSFLNFRGTATAGNATITILGSGDTVTFSGNSKAGAAIFNNALAGPGTVYDFKDNSSAQNAAITLSDSAQLSFGDNATAGSATIAVTGVSDAVAFDNSASAGTSHITMGGSGGSLTFNNDSTAGSARIDQNLGNITFNNNASAGGGTINDGGGNIYFNNASSAGAAAINLLQSPAWAYFYNTSTAGAAKINLLADTRAEFHDSATAGSAAITLADLDTIVTFYETSSGGTASFDLQDADAILDFSGVTNGVNQAGSLGGSGGTVYLGGNIVSIGGNNQSTSFAGVIADCTSDCAAHSLFLPEAPGTLKKVGTGTLTLTGDNLYTGNTIIEAGTLQLGNGGATGSITGNVANSGALTFNRSNAIGFPGVISGSGAVNLTGAGALTFTAAQTYSGPTTIDSGSSLALEANGNLANSSLVDNGAFDISTVTSGASIVSLTGSGTVTLGSKTLTLGNPSNATFSGILSGSGGLALTAGHEILTGTSTAFTGPTTVNGGTLSVNGAIKSSNVTVNSGGTLGGTGTVGLTTVNGGGTLAPGNSIGTLNVSGNLVFAAGSTYHVEVAPAASDLTLVSGTASLNGAVQADFAGGTYASGARYAIVTSTGALSGTFSSLSTLNLPSGFTASLSYDANDAYINLLGPAAPAAPVLDPQSGLIHATLAGAYIEDERLIRDAVLDHLLTDSDGVRIWGQGFAAFGALGARNPMDHNHAGFIAGVDMPLGDGFTAGLAGAWTGYKLTIQATASSARGQSGHAVAYVGWSDGEGLMLKGGGEYGWGSVNVIRLPSAGETDSAHQAADTAQIFGEAAFRLHFDGADIEPHGDIFWVMGENGAFSESGGASAMAGTALHQEAAFARLGVRGLGRYIDLGGIEAAPNLDIGVQMALSNPTPGMTVNFLSAPATTALLLGTPPANTAGTAQLGVKLKLGDRADLNVGYDGIFSSGEADHAVTARLAWRF